jgi:hypothetical protein
MEQTVPMMNLKSLNLKSCRIAIMLHMFCGGGHVGERKLWRQVLFSKSPFPEKMIVPGKSTSKNQVTIANKDGDEVHHPR